MSSEICFYLDQSKIMLSGNGLIRCVLWPNSLKLQPTASKIQQEFQIYPLSYIVWPWTDFTESQRQDQHAHACVLTCSALPMLSSIVSVIKVHPNAH